LTPAGFEAYATRATSSRFGIVYAQSHLLGPERRKTGSSAIELPSLNDFAIESCEILENFGILSIPRNENCFSKSKKRSIFFAIIRNKYFYLILFTTDDFVNFEILMITLFALI
jgi:hypothetical protein